MEKALVNSTRKSNIELLRILAIIFIIAHHLAVHGFHMIHPEIYASYSRFDKLFIDLLMPGGLVGVGIFFIITGYFKINNNKISLSKVILEALFYGLIVLIIYSITLAFTDFYKHDSIYSYFKNIFTSMINPATTDVWWFLSSYIFLILLSPLINKLFNKLNLKGYLVLTILYFLLIYSLDLVIGSRYITITKGIAFYLIGGFIARFITVESNRNLKRWISLFVFIISWCLLAYLYYFFYNHVYITESKNLIDFYNDLILFALNTILAPLAATSIFIFMLTFDFKSKAINFISKTTFGIYLLHDAVITRELIWKKVITTEIMEAMNLQLYSLILIASIFLIGFLVDTLRILFVEKHMINLYENIKNKFKEKYYNDDINQAE